MIGNETPLGVNNRDCRHRSRHRYPHRHHYRVAENQLTFELWIATMRT